MKGRGRKRRVLLTTLGLKKLEEARPYWKAAQAKMEAVLGDTHLGNLTEALREVRPDVLSS
jgi:DNA-binding MarR family transcriptional regulator